MDIVVVRVLIEEPNKKRHFKGTAFFINTTTLVTAKHVVQEAIDYNYKIYLSEIPNGGSLYISSDSIKLCERDIAVINLKKEFEIPPVFFCKNIKVGLDVELIGYHNEDGAINQYKHNISGYMNEQHTYEIQDDRTGGLSGSPILLDGKVCGITQAINTNKGVTYIIPISECCCDAEIKELINESLVDGIKLKTSYKKKNTFNKFFVTKYLLYIILIVIGFIGTKIYLCKSEKTRFDNILNEVNLDALWEKKGKYPSARKKLNEKAENIADRLYEDIDESCLLERFKIKRYEYMAYAYIIAADVEENWIKKKELADKSILMGNKALARIGAISKKTEAYRWVRNINVEERVKLLLTESHALLVRGGDSNLIPDTNNQLFNILHWYSDPNEEHNLSNIEWFLKTHYQAP